MLFAILAREPLHSCMCAESRCVRNDREVSLLGKDVAFVDSESIFLLKLSDMSTGSGNFSSCIPDK